MHPLFGEPRQIGLMSRDIDRSMRYFIDTWGVGPWYVLRNVKAPMLYRDQPTEPEISLALSHCGDLQFEIVAQHDDAPSLYREALGATPALHIQHLGIWTEDFAKLKADALAKGWTPIMESPPGPGSSCFVVHPDEPMMCIEISDCDAYKTHVRKVVREVALNWDGSEPIREGLPK